MPNIDFPNSPANNDTHTSAGRTWLWNNVYSSWVAFNSNDAGSVFVDTIGDTMTGNLVIQANVDAYYVLANTAVLIDGSNTGNRPSGSNGMIYHNTEVDDFEFYKGGAWTSGTISAALTRFVYTLNESDTQVTGADDNAATLDYDPNLHQAYLNGVLLVQATDYTTPNTTHLTGLTGIANNDVLQVDAWDVVNTLSGVPTSRQINSGTGLSGGGDLTVNRTLALDINGLTANATPNGAADYISFYDASAAATYKILMDDLPVGIGKHLMPFLARGIEPRTTNGPSEDLDEFGTNKHMRYGLGFDTAADEYAQWDIKMPKSWNESTITFAVDWWHGNTSTNFGVSWGLRAVALGNDDAWDTAFGANVVLSDTGGTNNDIYTTAESSAVTIAGTPAAGDIVRFEIFRQTGNTGDTLAIDAHLHTVSIWITTDASTDD
jgi:hypothetical protein